MQQRISCAQLNKISLIMLIFAKKDHICFHLTKVNKR